MIGAMASKARRARQISFGERMVVKATIEADEVSFDDLATLIREFRAHDFPRLQGYFFIRLTKAQVKHLLSGETAMRLKLIGPAMDKELTKLCESLKDARVLREGDRLALLFAGELAVVEIGEKL